MASTESIRELAEPVLASAGLELWDVEIERDIVRIMIERPARPVGAGGQQQGIDLDALSAASVALSPMLDAHPELAPEGRYQLEVSSPGVERTLRTPDQYRRYIDTEITVKTSEPVGGARRHRGRLLEAGPDGITFEPDDAAGTRVELRYDQIDRARTVLMWGPTAGPARGRKAPAGGGKSPARSAATARAAAALNPKDAGS